MSTKVKRENRFNKVVKWAYIINIGVWIVIMIIAIVCKKPYYKQFREKFDLLMSEYGYEYYSDHSYSDEVVYKSKNSNIDEYEFNIEYQIDGLEIDSLYMKNKEYNKSMLELLNQIYPGIDFTVFDGPIQEAINNKSYMDGNLYFSVNPDWRVYPMSFKICKDEYSESGYYISLNMYDYYLEQTLENLQSQDN